MSDLPREFKSTTSREMIKLKEVSVDTLLNLYYYLSDEYDRVKEEEYDLVKSKLREIRVEIERRVFGHSLGRANAGLSEAGIPKSPYEVDDNETFFVSGIQPEDVIAQFRSK